MKKTRNARLPALLLSLVLALGLCACGAETPEQALAAAGVNLGKARSMGYTMEIAMGLTAGGQAMDLAVTMDGEVTLDPEVSHTAVSIGLGAQQLAGMDIYTEKTDGGYAAWAGMADSSGTVQWIRDTVSAENTGITVSGTGDFLQGVEGLTERGRETVDGAETVRYDGRVSGDALRTLMTESGALDDLGSLLSDGGADPDALGASLEDVAISVWVDPAKKLPVRFSFDMTELIQGLMGEAAGSVMSLSETTCTLTLRDIDAVAPIEIPAEARAA